MVVKFYYCILYYIIEWYFITLWQCHIILYVFLSFNSAMDLYKKKNIIHFYLYSLIQLVFKNIKLFDSHSLLLVQFILASSMHGSSPSHRFTTVIVIQNPVIDQQETIYRYLRIVSMFFFFHPFSGTIP